VPLVQALRLGHLRLLAELVRPGGTGLLVTEVVSSDTCPDLPSAPAEALEGLLGELVRQKNFFTGLNPSVVVSTFRQDPALAAACERVEALPPWLWDFGARVYAVWALRFRRAVPSSR
jgi:hypothetical protein